jgi:Mg/Co/Ni transporter MgtE
MPQIKTYKDLTLENELKDKSQQQKINELHSQVLALQRMSLENLSRLNPNELKIVLDNLYKKEPLKTQAALPLPLVEKIINTQVLNHHDIYTNSTRATLIVEQINNLPKELLKLVLKKLNFDRQNETLTLF